MYFVLNNMCSRSRNIAVDPEIYYLSVVGIKKDLGASMRIFDTHPVAHTAYAYKYCSKSL